MRGWEEVEDDSADAADRFGPLTRAFGRFLQREKPTEVYVEGLPFVRSRRSIVSLAEVLGAVRALCVVSDVPHAVVPGYDWKRGLEIRGRDKAAVREWAVERAAPVQRWSQDLTDAYALAVWGYRWRGAR